MEYLEMLSILCPGAMYSGNTYAQIAETWVHTQPIPSEETLKLAYYQRLAQDVRPTIRLNFTSQSFGFTQKGLKFND